MFTFTAIFGILGTMKKRCTGLLFFFIGSEILHDDSDGIFAWYSLMEGNTFLFFLLKIRKNYYI